MNEDICVLQIDDDLASDSWIISIRSRRFQVRQSFRIRREWRGDPRMVQEYIERLIGGTLMAWAEADVPPHHGSEMAAQLMDHWQHLIFRKMAEIEHDHQIRQVRPTRHGDQIFFNEMAGPVTLTGMHFGVEPRESEKAKQKARQLLLRHLDDGQRKSFERERFFRVTAQDGKVYKITDARSFNVIGPDGTKFCGQILNTPVEDQMLAQKIMLQQDSKEFFKKCNISAPGGGFGMDARWHDQYEQLLRNDAFYASIRRSGGPSGQPSGEPADDGVHVPRGTGYAA